MFGCTAKVAAVDDQTCLQGPLPGTVRTCTVGIDFESVEQLFSLSHPCIVKGLEPELHAAVMESWSLEVLKSLKGKLPLKVFRHANQVISYFLVFVPTM